MNSLSSDPSVIVLGERLRQLRELRGISLTYLAKQAGVAKSYLAKLERGEVPNPGLTTIARIAKVLETTLPQLLAPVTSSHHRPRWSKVIDPLEIERLKESMSPSLIEFLKTLEQQTGNVPADVIRSLAVLQVKGKRPNSLEAWRFVYEAMCRSV